jgi:hypothetical protein
MSDVGYVRIPYTAHRTAHVITWDAKKVCRCNAALATHFPLAT